MSNPRASIFCLLTYIPAKACYRKSLFNAKKERESNTANQQKVLLFPLLIYSAVTFVHGLSLTHHRLAIFFFIFKYNQPLPLCLPPSPPCNFNSQINRLEREASSLRKRIFTLRVNKSKFIAGSEKDLKLTAVILELDSVLQLKNRQLLDIRLGTSL